jgi:hypothetical protein
MILLVEVKCFSDESAATTDLYVALGQYIVYRSLLVQQKVSAELHLAVDLSPQKLYQAE